MSLDKVFFGFFVLFAATLNFGFFIGDVSNPDLHSPIELYAALIVSLAATIIKLGDRTQIGAVHLATSLVADIQLIAAAIVHAWANTADHEMTAGLTSTVVSLSGGALFANVISVVLLVIETSTFRRR